jgi:hypothetical protein
MMSLVCEVVCRKMRGAALAWSLELSTVGLLKAGSTSAPLLGRLPPGTRVYLPALPTDPPSAIADSLELLHKENRELIPVPHVAASREASADSVEKRFLRWQQSWPGGLREVLVVRGDPRGAHGGSNAAATTSGCGAFRTSLELLESGVLQQCGIGVVGLCGHPEGVSGVSADEARAALITKLDWAERVGVRARVVTQFCFDAALTTAYVDALREDGVHADVSIGIVGPDVAMKTRHRMADICGVAAPASPSTTGYMRALSAWQAERGAMRGMQALHMYPFSSLARTLQSMNDFETGASRNADGSPYAKLHLEPPLPVPPLDFELRQGAA